MFVVVTRRRGAAAATSPGLRPWRVATAIARGRCCFGYADEGRHTAPLGAIRTTVLHQRDADAQVDYQDGERRGQEYVLRAAHRSGALAAFFT